LDTCFQFKEYIRHGYCFKPLLRDIITLLHYYASRKIYKDNTLAAFTVKLAQPIDLGTDENWEVGLCEIACPPPTAGTLKPVLIVGVTNVLVYCNLISQQFVGESAVRFLRSFIFKSDLCQNVFKEVFYIPVEQRRFQDIWIAFLTLQGKRVYFKGSKNPTKVILHFRKSSQH